MGGGCLVGRGRFETCPYVRLRGASWLVARVGAGIPLRSLRSASPFAERKGTVVVALRVCVGWPRGGGATDVGCLVGRGRFETCPYVLLWGLVGWWPASARASPAFASLRVPFRGAKGTVVVAPLLPGHPLRASLRLLASPYAEAKGTNGTVCARCDGLVQIWVRLKSATILPDRTGCRPIAIGRRVCRRR